MSRDHERMRLESYDSLPTLGGTLSTEELGRQRLRDYYQICVGLVIVIRILRCDQRSDDSKGRDRSTGTSATTAFKLKV